MSEGYLISDTLHCYNLWDACSILIWVFLSMALWGSLS